MQKRFEPLGNHIHLVDDRNIEETTTRVLGISIDKFFIPSVANVIGTDLSNYKLLKRGFFACNPMHVGRDERLPVSLFEDDEPGIVSPAYFMFKIVDTERLNADYLMLWFRRPEFDRQCWFRTDSSVRGGITWDDICRMTIQIPPIEEQREIVKAYKIVENRIILKKRINDNLESFLSTRFSLLCADAASRGKTTLDSLISFGNGKSRPSSLGSIPVYGGNGILSYTDRSNAENVVLIGRVGAYCGSVYIEERSCWVSDNAIVAKSKVSDNEYFDYFLLKWFNLYDHHVGTGQQLLTQGILNSLECPSFHTDEIRTFNEESKPIFTRINANKREINMLTDLSSVLLSRLSH